PVSLAPAGFRAGQARSHREILHGSRGEAGWLPVLLAANALPSLLPEYKRVSHWCQEDPILRQCPSPLTRKRAETADPVDSVSGCRKPRSYGTLPWIAPVTAARWMRLEQSKLPFVVLGTCLGRRARR